MAQFPQYGSLIALALLLAACSTDDESVTALELREAQPAPQQQRAGSLLVEYNAASSNGVSVHAQFLEVRGVSLEAAFDALDAWSPDSELDLDACSIRLPPSAGDEADQVRLHMLDVGPIDVSALDHSIHLAGRRVPDLAAFSGVVYGNEEGYDFDEAFLPYEPLARYQISAPGGDETGGFGISLQAPTVPEIEAVSGRYTVDAAPIDLGGGELALEWNGEPESNTALYLDLHTGAQRLKCRVEDDGRFIVPASVLEQVANGRPLQLTLRRVDTLELAIDGVEQGSFIFAATDEATVIP